tara:strand:- start:4015 stop:4188 length:174 start_codon:yes stop_codon:yes gene_type:complete
MTKYHFKVCPVCEGDGVVMVEVIKFLPQNYSRFAEPDYVDEEQVCEECEGYGEIKII